MTSQFRPLLFHILCDDYDYELEIYQSMLSHLCAVNTCDSIREQLTLPDDYDLDVITASNRTLFVGDFVSVMYNNKLTSLPRLAPNTDVHIKHVLASFSLFRNTMVVSQRVTNWITADKLYQIDKNGIQSVFVHLTTENTVNAQQPRTAAILRWCHRFGIPIQHYHKRCSSINEAGQEHNLILTSIFDIIDLFLQRDNLVHSMTATLKLFTSGCNGYDVLDKFLFLESTVTPKQLRKQPRNRLGVPLQTTANKTMAMFHKQTTFMQDAFHKIESNKIHPIDKLQLSLESTILPTDSALIRSFVDNGVQLMFWDNTGVDDIVLSGDRKQIESMLKEVFKDFSTCKAISTVLLHKDTKCLWLEYTARNAHARKPTCFACVVFRILHEPPFGTIVSYLCLHRTLRIYQINTDLGRDEQDEKIHGQGIGSKLLNLTQYIAWIYVCNISLHLCATKSSVDFYHKLKFIKNNCAMDDLPTIIQGVMQLERILH